MYVLVRKLTKYNAFNIEKNTQHNAICYTTILQLLHYFINQSTTSDTIIITVKYITIPIIYLYYLLYHLLRLYHNTTTMHTILLLA